MCSHSLLERVRRVVAYYQPKIMVAEYIGMSPCLNAAAPNTVKIIDTHDVFSARAGKVVAHGIVDPFACDETQERRCLLRANVIMAIQQDEATLLKRMAPEREVITVELDPDIAAEPLPGKGKGLLIVASNNPSNVHGVEGFLSIAWPVIRARHPDATLRIAGRVCDKLARGGAGVEMLDWVEDVRREYEAACVVINPVVAGTGLKIKSIEALARGKCLVSMSNGVEGIAWQGKPPFIECATWDAMAEAIMGLLSDEGARRDLAKRALNYAGAMYNPNRVYEELKLCLQRKGLLG